MISTLIGKKIDQTQKFLENGKRIPVTLISVSDNSVLQVKTQAQDGYTAVQLGVGSKKKPTKSLAGHSKKAGFATTARYIREVRVADAESGLAAGESIAVDAVFKPGDIVTITGTSKGKGFAGVVKRHNFRGGPKTHGQSDRERAPGSIGQTTTPGRVYKGKRMAGRAGSDTVTVPNLTVVAVDIEGKVLLVTGLVPGHRNAMLLVTKTGTRKKFVELLGEKAKRDASASSAQDAAEAPVIEEKIEEAKVEIVEDAAPVEEEKVEEEVSTEKEEEKK